jgi:hypothetical protein
VIPDEEIDHLTQTVDEVIGLAADGRVGEGYRLLSEGRLRAHNLRLLGHKWGRELAERWDLACDNYAEAYGVPIADPT